MAFLDNIKERLGFGEAEEEEFDEELYGEDYDAYSEGFDNAGGYEEDEYSASEQDMRLSSSRRDRSSSSRRGASHPNLVSIEDVRNSTRVPESLNRDPLPPRRSGGFGRNVVGHASDYALSGSESQEAPYASSRSYAAPVSDVAADQGGYDPYRVYEAGSATSHRPTRSVSTLSPVAYSEVENVARMLRAGDAVVLSLRNTPSQLSKRILDFSFGVASALDASVDCIADKVFAITRGEGLNNDELSRLRGQGII